MTETKTLRAAAYVRVSTKRQAEEGLSLDEQQRTAEARCEREGWHLLPEHIYSEAISAAKDRPALDALLAAAARGEFDVLIVREVDRVGRSLVHLSQIVTALDDASVRIVSLTGMSVDVSTAEGKLQFNVLASVAQYEREKIGERVASVTAARAAQGKAHGRASYGYRPGGKKGILVNPAEAAVVQRIFREYLAGASQREIADGLIRDGIRAQRGEWVQGTISKVLSNPVYAGTVRLNGETYQGTHEAIIDLDTWRKAEQMRSAAVLSGKGRRPVANHVLAGGLLRCGCGAAMNAITKPTRTPGVAYEVYRCKDRPACKQPPVRRQLIDDAVWRFFEKVALDVDATKAALHQQHDAQVAEITALRAQADRDAQKTAEALARIERDYRDEKLTAEQWARLDGNLTSELQAAQAQVARLDQRKQAITDEIEQIDAEATVLEQIAALRAMVVGEVRDGSRESVDGFRAALRRLFTGFALLGGARPFGTGLADGVGWPHPDLALDGLELYPHIRADVIESWGGGDGDFPALRRAALTLSASDAKTLHT